jgi:hypothetical protein
MDPKKFKLKKKKEKTKTNPMKIYETKTKDSS